MLTKTEKYLKENRKLLDVEFPDDDLVWKNIRKTQGNKHHGERKKNISILRSLPSRIAASVIILMALSYVITDLTVGVPINRKDYLSEINSEYANIEEDYIKTVKLKEKDVRETSIPDNDLTRTIASELKQLDKMYKSTMADLKELGDNEKVVNTIFNIYERKIELLERIIIETKKAENYEKNMESNI